VLIQGETGVGKELVARALHNEGSRARGPFVDVNCAAIPADLLENELFGHESEAFTGAAHRRKGKIEAANGGTLFLDEIGELDSRSQAKLLRVLQNRRVERLGGARSVPVDVRVVAATNRNLSEEVGCGRFRADLYYRLSVYPLHVQPLRERREDIPLLVQHFVERAAVAEGRSCPTVRGDALELLTAYAWPGNVRELDNVIRRVTISLDGDVLRAQDLPGFLHGTTADGSRAPLIEGTSIERGNVLADANRSELPSLEEVERRHVAAALSHCRGNLSEAARVLGIGRTTLYRKIEKYGLDPGVRS
jgi:DNA-binding NtrC family response regulator